LRELMDRMATQLAGSADLLARVEGPARHIADGLKAQIKAARAKGDQK
jgi:hypothetical protein